MAVSQSKSSVKTWEYDLQEYPITKDVSNDYVATVKTRASLAISEVIRLICAERTDLRFETIQTSYLLLAEKIIYLLQQGYTVSTELINFLPGITGLFDESHQFDPARNQCVINPSPTKRLRTAIAEVAPVYSGTMVDSGRAKIEFVQDVSSKLYDGKITPGGIVHVKGSKIRCVDETGQGFGKIVFLNASTLAEVAEVSETTVGLNNPSQLMFIAPSTLSEGEYVLRIETYFSQTSRPLKNKRIIDYGNMLYVGDKENDDVEDGPVVQ